MNNNNNNNLESNNNIQPNIVVERDPFYNKSVLVLDGAIQQVVPELLFEINEDLRNKVRDLDKDNWMYETNSSRH